ncbi:MAG TPA: glycosyl hydrolase family 31, partial [Paludibacter sp.]
MKLKLLLIAGLFPFLCQGQVVKNFKQEKTGVTIVTDNGLLGIYPIANNAARVKFSSNNETELPELVFGIDNPVPTFRIEETPSLITVKTAKITVAIDKQSGKLSFLDATGKTLVNELAGSRKLVPGTVQGEPCFLAEQTFDSPTGEAIFGLGQFQDGQYNLKGVARRLTQVNTQISLPFIYSSRGYGLLWHQYGLTDFNPADNSIVLNKLEQATAGNQEAEVTTTSGTQK